MCQTGALILASHEAVKEHKLTPIARIGNENTHKRRATSFVAIRTILIVAL
jgi:hypothetical protein